MSQYEKLREWLDRLVDTQFRDAIRALLDVSDQTAMKAPVDTIDRTSFLGHMQELVRLDDVEEYLKNKLNLESSDVSGTNGHGDEPTSKQPVPWPDGTDVTNGVGGAKSKEEPRQVDFTNRTTEIDKLTSRSAGCRYFLVQAPAAYGKSALLRRVAERYASERSWRKALVSVKPTDSLDRIGTVLEAELGILRGRAELSIGYRIGSEWKRMYSSDLKEGLILMFDFQGDPDPYLLKGIVDEFLPDFADSFDSLMKGVPGLCQLRVVLAGRSLVRMLAENRPARIVLSKPVRLSTFNYDNIQDSVATYLPNEHPSVRDELAAHLLYLTGGHPACMAQVLQRFDALNVPVPEYLRIDRDIIWSDIVRPAVRAVVDDLPKAIKELDLLGSASVFRYIDRPTLRKISPEDFGDSLTRELLTREETSFRFLTDTMVRRLVVVSLRTENEDRFVRYCRQAQEHCLNGVMNSQHPEMWIIEYLFQELQQLRDVDFATAAQREALRQRFLEIELYKALEPILSKTDLAVDDRRDTAEAIDVALGSDLQWEFRFAVNYYLRNEQFSSVDMFSLVRQRLHGLLTDPTQSYKENSKGGGQ